MVGRAARPASGRAPARALGDRREADGGEPHADAHLVDVVACRCCGRCWPPSVSAPTVSACAAASRRSSASWPLRFSRSQAGEQQTSQARLVAATAQRQLSVVTAPDVARVDLKVRPRPLPPRRTHCGAARAASCSPCPVSPRCRRARPTSSGSSADGRRPSATAGCSTPTQPARSRRCSTPRQPCRSRPRWR